MGELELISIVWKVGEGGADKLEREVHEPL